MTTEPESIQSELNELNQTIAGLRKYLSGPALDAAFKPLLEKQAALQAQLTGSQVATTGSLQLGGAGSVMGSYAGENIITGDATIVYAEKGATVVIGEIPVQMAAVNQESALGQYLQHLISRNRYLQLQGIRSGGRLVHIELDQIYITLRASRRREVEADWLAQESTLAPGERRRKGEDPNLSIPTPRSPTASLLEMVSVNEALAESRRLVILGDPGSGKTTLLRYLTLLYAGDVADKSQRVQTELNLAESGYLPILLYLRQIGAFLKSRRPSDDGTEGHALLLDFLRESLANAQINLPANFFDDWLSRGRVVILLDGLDEVADPELRRRVARMVEAFGQTYPNCRYVITSRVVGYTGPARLGEGFAVTTVRDFSLAEVERFLTNWHRLVAIGQMGPGHSAEVYAAEQTRQLLAAIQANERIRELAINPLLLTVIAMVHRDRVKLPDRRAELYGEAVDVLLGKWEEAKGVVETPILENQPFDAGDKRLLLQGLALYMQEKEVKELTVADLRRWLGQQFYELLKDWRAAARVVDRFLNVIEERTGLLAARGEGVYAFSHLTFQEYLAALAVAGRDDYIEYSLPRSSSEWWREVILLAAGHLSMQSRDKTARLIRAIADLKTEPQPYHNLVLAAQCLRDVGENRIPGNLLAEIQNRLRADIQLDLLAEINRRRPRFGWEGWWRQVRGQSGFAREAVLKEIIDRKAIATQALIQSGVGYWKLPFGEPEWIEISAGTFWLGSDTGRDDEKPLHELHLETFWLARTPITNAQYHLFVQATGHPVPSHWQDNHPPKGLESHPVVNVTWEDALAYCRWLSQVTGKTITLPSEAEWEKAARGDKDQRIYPWGDTFEATRCNCDELGLGDTTPVGIFPNGASPYGCLDMAGNVWEWTRSQWGSYPYNPHDGREDLEGITPRVLRGGAFSSNVRSVRCAARLDFNPDYRLGSDGFRVCVVGVSPS